LKILLIEDNPDHAFLERQALERQLDAEVVAEPRPSDGLRRIAEEDLDVVVLDYQLPGADGLDVLRRIKRARADLPVVVITAAGSEEVAVAAMKEGASDYLVKRFGSSAEESKLAASVRRSLEQAELARAYRRSQEILQTTLELAWDGIAYVNLATLEISSANDSLCRMLGAPRAGLDGRPITSLFVEADRPRIVDVLRRVREENPRPRAGPGRARSSQFEEDELHLLAAAGERRTIDLRTVAVDIDGAPSALMKVRDITEKKRIQARLVQAQKMEAIGTLAGGIAHDFNNLLGAILGYASFLKRHIQPDDRLFKSVQTIEAAAERAAELVQRLLSFSRRGPQEATPFSLNAMVEETMRLLSRSIPETVAIDPHLAPDLPAVEGQETQVQQALLNVCLNARDAMPQGGTLEISTAEAGAADLATPGLARGERGERRFLVATVRDTGVGMTPEVLSRVFEPFFTTKARGKGTGLGLATSYAIVKAHGGAIDVTSEPGRGTQVRIVLPASKRPSSGREEAPEGPALRESEQEARVLVVDDEVAIRDLTSDILAELGYRVELAASGQEALDRYAAAAGAIDLVILDIIMPGMNGVEAFRRLRAADPHARILLSSGYSPEGTAAEALDEGALGFVQKPYRVADLAKAVREALRAPVP
jgi:PAS domain S-box-containing protein